MRPDDAGVEGESAPRDSGGISGVRRRDVPATGASEREIAAFALGFDGYAACDGFDECAEIANKAVAAWERDGRLPSSLHDLQVCLFFEHRRWRHFGEPMDAEAERYVRAVVEAIRELSPR